MNYGRAYNVILSISKKLDINFNQLVSSISFLCALHDIGKAHPSFISKMYSKTEDEFIIGLYEQLKEQKLIDTKDYSGFRHERFSRDIIRKYFNNRDLDGDTYADLVAYHHHGKSENDFIDIISLKDLEWLSIIDEIISVVENEWHFSSSLCDTRLFEDNPYVNGLSYIILSILIISDWIASGSQWYTLCKDNQNLSKRELAKKFIEENELNYYPLKERFKDIKWNDVFSFPQNILQEKAINVAKKMPSLMIIEYPCGGGKTEAALVAATIIGKEKSGIYIATPTMSTAKGMTLRMNELASKIGLGLHIPEFDSSSLWSDNDMTKIPKELWTSKSRHKLLYPFAVGTIDQILKSILAYRYSCISVTGISDKVLIIDEVHAYDSYMLTELRILLKWCNFLDVPVILLSATLPTITKQELLKAAGCKETDLSNEYPLITAYKKNELLIQESILCEGRKLNIKIIESDYVKESFVNELEANYSGCTAYLEGTVDDTWRLFDEAKLLNKENLMIFHGRDTLEHKENKTLELIYKLGKYRSHRPKELSLITTSIIEQSLDIDLDRLITNIAPIDLLIQRFGRVWRHSDIGTIREIEKIDYPITIIIPKDLSKISKIYNIDVLKNTINVLKDLTAIDTVKDARWLIDTVYNSRALIDNLSSIFKAGRNIIGSPFSDENTILNNEVSSYMKFHDISSHTREESYPTISIGIIDNEKELEDITYQKVRDFMRKNVVGLSSYKVSSLHIEPIKVSDRFLNDVNFYLVEDLRKAGVELTENGLRIDK